MKNQFGQELKELATMFGRLLRPSITTIDRVGLRTSHLNKHKAAVDNFMDALGLKYFKSDIVVRYQQRIVKYRERLS